MPSYAYRLGQLGTLERITSYNLFMPACAAYGGLLKRLTPAGLTLTSTLVFLTGAVTGCDSRQRCDLNEREACGETAQCVADANGEGYCEELASCDPQEPDACPGGYVCRPISTGASVCEPTATAGRIPSCVDSEGIDVFAVEANSALSITWNMNAPIDFAGGFDVAYGTAKEAPSASVHVSADAREATVSPLPNGTTQYVVVRALGANGEPSFTSCQVAAVPHVLVFAADLPVSTSANPQRHAAIASNVDGSRLYLAYEEDGRVALLQSNSFGDGWTASSPGTAGATQGAPALAVRDAVYDTSADGGTPVEVTPEVAFVAFTEGSDVKVLPARRAELAPAVRVGAGAAPAIAVGAGKVHVAFESGGSILYSASSDEGATFSSAIKVSGATTNSGAPSIAVDALSGDVFVGWHGNEGAGDSNVYFAASRDSGATFSAPVRIDNDGQGLNQLNVSVAFDLRSGALYATWEDRRGGANVYFSQSTDRGATWSANVDVGAGLGGDQFRPRAVVDVAGNVYVAFQDTTSGARVVFTRFNSTGSFDPPLQPSTQAGSGGVVGDRPAVATDRYGTVYVAWEENRGGPATRIIFARAE